jgi:hypothetical protein
VESRAEEGTRALWKAQLVVTLPAGGLCPRAPPWRFWLLTQLPSASYCTAAHALLDVQVPRHSGALLGSRWDPTRPLVARSILMPQSHLARTYLRGLH